MNRISSGLRFLPLISLMSFSAFAAPVKLLAPSEGETVALQTDHQKAYIAMPAEERRAKFADQSFRSKMQKGDSKTRKTFWPKAVPLKWEAAADTEYVVKVIDAKTDKVVFEESVKGDSTEVDNLEVARDYVWSVSAAGDAAKGMFKTEGNTPRFVRFPGVPNVRDFGGRIGLGGKPIKQGLVFRSAGLNDNATKAYYTVEELRQSGKAAEIEAAKEPMKKRLAQLKGWKADPSTMDENDEEYKEWCARHRGEPAMKFITSRIDRASKALEKDANPHIEKPGVFVPGKNRVDGENGEYILARFGIRTDIDLRSDREVYGMKGSPLGGSVKWLQISSSAYGGMQKQYGRDQFTKVFKVFLDEKNYPIDFHCIAGQDRTGAVSYILGALLGVSEDELALDWEVTGFWNPNANFNHSKLFDGLVKGFKNSYPDGKNATERVEAYILSLGFTENDIAKFRNFMLED